MTQDPSRRKHCDARNKRLVELKPDGRAISLNPRCRNWAMPNGRCRLHGGLSTGPKTPEGKAAVARAMHAGRRLWVANLRAQGLKIPGGRKSGAAWITPALKMNHTELAAFSKQLEVSGSRRTADTSAIETARLLALRLLEAMKKQLASTSLEKL